MQYLDPRNDVVFKRIFGEHKDILAEFLNAMLPLPNPIVELEYLTPEQAPEVPGMKFSVVDVRCKDSKGRQFLVEMQNDWTREFAQRIVFNACKAYVYQLQKGEAYFQLKPVYALNLLNDVAFPTDPGYYHHFAMVSANDPERRLEGV